MEELLNESVGHSVSEKMLRDALAGRKEYIIAVFKKLFPDKIATEHKGELTFTQRIRQGKLHE